jgi:hypothetical protein
MDGRGHPADILDYPEWMGHSIGRWDGDTLVVDTIGMREETWLDTAGFEHSPKLHITERFQKTGPDAIRLTTTIEDPVFYTKPFTYGRNRAAHAEGHAADARALRRQRALTRRRRAWCPGTRAQETADVPDAVYRKALTAFLLTRTY